MVVEPNPISPLQIFISVPTSGFPSDTFALFFARRISPVKGMGNISLAKMPIADYLYV